MRLTQTVPALPVRDTAAAAQFYRDRLSFTVLYEGGGFARLARDDAEVHLWQADDAAWAGRDDFADRPVRSGAEDFLAGTASCRIMVDDVDALYTEMQTSGVLHYRDSGSAVDTDYGTREFAVTDDDGNLIVFFRRR